MVGYEQLREEFKTAGTTIIAGTVDDHATTQVVQDEVGFPIAINVDRKIGTAIGAWWDEKRDFIQPSEFLLRRDGRVVAATYSTGPVGRMDPAEMLSMIRFIREHSRS